MATSRPVRIARHASEEGLPVAPPAAATPSVPELEPDDAPAERRVNGAGSQRAIRVTIVYLVVLVALYAAFLLYDRSAPGGSAPPSTNGVLLFTGIFVAFALVGSILTLHPAPRSIEVAPDHVTVVGRWGWRRRLPPLGSLSTRVLRRYPTGFLADAPVEQVELWSRDAPLRTYLVEDGLFRGTTTVGAAR